MSRLLISGYYGYGNAGDEAILASMVAAFRSSLPGVSITVISHNPNATRREHSVEAVSRIELPAFLSALAHADALLTGGGSLLQDVTSVRSLVYYLGVMATAKALGKRVMVFANGFGPVTSRQGRFMARHVLDRVDIATFRDANSLDEVRGLGVSRPRMELTADPAFLLDELTSDEQRSKAQAGADEALRVSGMPPTGGPVVGISLRPWKHAAPSFTGSMRAAIQSLVAGGARVVLLPLHLREDLGFCDDLARRSGGSVFVIRSRLEARAVMELIGRLDVLVGMRLHSLIFAVSKGLPCAAIPYDPKVSSLVDAIGLPIATTIGEPDAGQFYGTVERMLSNRESLAAIICQRRNEQRILALRNFELVA